MLGISGTELVIILFFAFLIFGPEKLPQMGRTVGRAIRQFREATDAANKKFKEEVADPFQDAVAPYKDQVEEAAKPIQDDIAAINDTLSETKSAFTDPFKDMLKPNDKDKAERASIAAVVTGSAPDDAGSLDENPQDPFAGVLDDSEEEKPPKPQGKPIPDAKGTVKKSMAASLYDLDDAKDGE